MKVFFKGGNVIFTHRISLLDLFLMINFFFVYFELKIFFMTLNKCHHRGGVGEAIAILDSGYYLSQVI